MRATGLRHNTLQEEGRRDNAAQRPGKGEPVPSHPQEAVETEVRPPGELRLLRGGLAVVATAPVLACNGLAIGTLADMAWTDPATAVMQVQTDITTTVVHLGQSLWDVVETSGTADVPGVVVRIAELNGLKGTAIRAGQTLEIPTA